MIIKRLKTKNYRSLENLEISFNPFYNALSGKNNSGKSNIIRALLAFLTYDFRFLRDYSENVIHYASDYPNSKRKDKTKEEIYVEIELELDESNDAGLFKFIKELIFKDETEFSNSKETLRIIAIVEAEQKDLKIKTIFGNHEISDEYKREELLNRLRGSGSVLFHNSTENDPIFLRRARRDNLISYIGKEDRTEITKRKESLENEVKKLLKKHQTQFSSLLGRLEDKYDVSLGISSLNIERESVEISLKEKGIEVSLDDWGSGTKNRTLILLNLMNAKRVQESSSVNDRLTPIIVIEEPESFLHPSAQAEFGRVLQDLAFEFKIQIIVATHSPYLLSHKEPSANILLQKNLSATVKGSEIVNTSGDKWYEPFALSLGISGDDFGPLKSTIFSGSSDIILVEGESDKEYFELLKDEKHGNCRLNFNGEIFPYGGAGNIKNNILLRFIKERFKRFVVTVDLDKFPEVKSAFDTLGLKENKEFIVIGKNETGKKCIEGLIPHKLLSQVYSDNVELVQKAMENSPEGKNCRNHLKTKILEKFKIDGQNDLNNFNEFYLMIKPLNKIFK
ncbi:ATP-dependent nuclease [Flavihumibacter sp.]|uniref:ATP-dependent nuclease n=1 Tax=Flavihumibacter sp. TaxID=1913981 RepID=UPI002FC982F6